MSNAAVKKTDNENEKKWQSLVKGTKAQIEALESDKYLTVVSAGAGTGKTQTLAQRFAWLLASDPECNVDEILVLTFTQKAAREMNERIKSTLENWYEKESKELAHLKKSINSIDDAYISTIHAFAMKLIRESGLELDIDPTAGIIPNPKIDIWWRAFEDMLASDDVERILSALPESWREKAGALMEKKSFKDAINSCGAKAIAEAAKNASEKLYCAGETPEELWERDDSRLLNSVAEVEKELKTKERETCEVWVNSVIPAMDNFLSSALAKNKKLNGAETKFRDFISRWYEKEAKDEAAYKDFCEELLNDVCKPRIPTGKAVGVIEDNTGQSFKDWRDEMNELRKYSNYPSDEEREINAVIRRICAIGWKCWDEFRRREGLLSISDLIFYARKILTSSESYKQKFKHIMVDEFQDTDPLQNELIKALWVSPDEESDFHNTLFLVGDKKQSIYRFRHADLKLFQEYISKADYLDDGGLCKYVSLDQNFRTAVGLLDSFNYVFDNLWTEDRIIAYESLCRPDNEEWCAKRNEYIEEPYVNLMRRVKDKVGEARRTLFDDLGREFKRMVEAKYKVWDKKEEKFRSVRYGDFAVLVPGRTSYDVIESAFESLEIPYILQADKNYFNRSETTELVNLISLLSEPKDPVFLLSWILSPFCGLKEEEARFLIDAALEEKEERKPLPLFDTVKREREEIIDRIFAMRDTALLSGVPSVIYGIMSNPRYLEYYGNLRRSSVNANIVHLAQLAEEYERSEGRSLKGCAEYLQNGVDEILQTEAPEFIDEDSDAVKVMTIHASKGLEFPIVALLYSDYNNRSAVKDKIPVSKNYGPLVGKIHAAAGYEEVETVSGLLYKREEKDEGEGEHKRLLYVGFTRARDKLILCEAKKESKKSAEKNPLIIDLLIENGAEEIKERDEKEPEAVKAKKDDNAQDKILELKCETPAMLGRLSASAYAMISWCPAAYRIVYRQGRKMKWSVKGGEGGGSEFGSLTHCLLKRWDFRPESLALLLPQDKDSVEYNTMLGTLPFELRGEFASGAKRARILEILQNYAKSDECRRFAKLAAENKLSRETRFRVRYNDTVLVGSTDLYWRDEKGIHLRDWKTSEEETAPDIYYDSQLDFYAFALNLSLKERSAGELIDSALIYLRDKSDERKIRTYTPEDMEQIASSIKNAAIKALSGDFDAESERCAVCPWKSECAKREICR